MPEGSLGRANALRGCASVHLCRLFPCAAWAERVLRASSCVRERARPPTAPCCCPPTHARTRSPAPPPTHLPTQVVEAGLGHLPFKERTVITPTGHQYVGVEFARKLCGVSIIRSGESMENALRACCKGIKIGKILVHR